MSQQERQKFLKEVRPILPAGECARADPETKNVQLH